MAKEMPWQSLAYSYKVDKNSPTMLSKKAKIFELDEKDVGQSPCRRVSGKTEYFDSSYTAAQNFAASAGIEGSYGAFSGAASMSATNDASSRIETARVDVSIKAQMYTIQASSELQVSPGNKVFSAVKDFIGKSKPDEIVRTFGEFYITQAELGGLFTKSYVSELTEKDSQTTIITELKAKYGADLVGSVSGSAKLEFGQRSSNKNAKTKTTWHCEGGETTLWLGLGDEGLDRVQKLWAASVRDDNLFCYKMKVTPIWVLVANIDGKKGDEVQAYIKKMWESGKLPCPSKFVDPEEVKLVAKEVHKCEMKEAGSDSGSGAKIDLKYWEYAKGDWLMLGHSFLGESMMVVEPGPWVKKATGWKRVWNDKGSSNSADYDIYIPTCGDSNFLALGVICHFNNKDHAEPPSGMPVACVHKDLCEATSCGDVVWKDAGTRAKYDVTLNKVPFIGTMWPTKADLFHPGYSHKLKASAIDRR